LVQVKKQKPASGNPGRRGVFVTQDANGPKGTQNPQNAAVFGVLKGTGETRGKGRETGGKKI